MAMNTLGRDFGSTSNAAQASSTPDQIRHRLSCIMASLEAAGMKLSNQLDTLLGGTPRPVSDINMQQVATPNGIFGDLQRLDDLTQALHRELDRLG